jgi:hypothetical protein
MEPLECDSRRCQKSFSHAVERHIGRLSSVFLMIFIKGIGEASNVRILFEVGVSDMQCASRSTTR